MPTRFPLQSLLDHAKHRMEAAERLLRMLKNKEDAAQRRMDELRNYRAEYQTRLTGGGELGMGIMLLRDFYAFMAKLEQAIEHQRNEVDHARARWQVAHDDWLGLRQKVQAYETLASRHLVQENRRLEQREQRLSDEAALRKHAHRHTPS